MRLEQTFKIKAFSESEAKDLIEDYRVKASSENYLVKKAGYEYKNKKSKGEIIDEAWVVTITLTYASLWD